MKNERDNIIYIPQMEDDGEKKNTSNIKYTRKCLHIRNPKC